MYRWNYNVLQIWNNFQITCLLFLNNIVLFYSINPQACQTLFHTLIIFIFVFCQA